MTAPVGIWAPAATRVELVVGAHRRALTRGANGWHRSPEPLPTGTRYAFSLDGGDPMPDPRSQRQPDGVFAPSEIVDHSSFAWTDHAWPGLHLSSAVLYELHVGAFTEGGTFRAAIDRLDHLVDLGIDAIELMPVAAFDGGRGWGYDSVALYAPHEPYGGPDGLKALVDAAHGQGLGVVLDVVWNHLGPTGNRLGEAGPYFTDAVQTPWGAAVNLDGADSGEVRRFLLDNAAHWFEHYHLDGLRLDAVHALVDASPTHLLAALADETRSLAARIDRPLWLIAESDANDPNLTRPRDAGGLGMDAQWADDLHHAIHVAVTGERDGYYADYRGALDVVAAYERGFVFDGRWSEVRQRPVGGSTVGIPRDRFITCSQNHDQVGNRARGERLVHLAGHERAKVAAALVLAGPGVPMLFMGEEWAASTPFPYFVGPRSPELDDAVREGRRAEFAAFAWEPAAIPDPVAEATMRSAVLCWDERDADEHASMLAWYRALIRLRRQERDLTDPTPGTASGSVHDGLLWLRRGTVEIVANLGDASVTVRPDGANRELLLASTPDVWVTRNAISLPAAAVAVFRTGRLPGEVLG